NLAGTHNNLGVALVQQGSAEEAIASYDRALALDPEHADARANRARALLLTGDYRRGWTEYEWRGRGKHRTRPLGRPAWDGGPLPGGTLLLHAEQGLGDTLHFARYAALAKQRSGAARVVLECQQPLAAVLTGCPGVDEVVSQGGPLPAFDRHAALL